MEFPVVHLGQTIGSCSITDDGLYWNIACNCEILSDQVERLYWGSDRIGVLEQNGRTFTCRKRLSKASVPGFPENSTFSLSPYQIWDGRLLGKRTQCIREGDELLFPYEEDQPCPCEALVCFFSVSNGFWRLPVRPEWIN